MGSLITFMLHCVLLFYNSDCENIFVGTVCVILRLIWKTRECIRLCIIVGLWDECVKCVCVYSWPYSICNENLPVAVKISFLILQLATVWLALSLRLENIDHHPVLTPVITSCSHPSCPTLFVSVTSCPLILAPSLCSWSVFKVCGWLTVRGRSQCLYSAVEGDPGG